MRNRNILSKLNELEKFREYQELSISALVYNKNLRILLLRLINNLEVRTDGIYLKEGDRALISLYKLITYGNLELKPCSIIKDAIAYGMKRTVLQLTYGN